jgi:sugar/nucleoside kinase (ribokinase family)
VIDAKEAPGRLLIMGDLCLDFLITQSDPTGFDDLGNGSESTVRSACRLAIGGSAWLLAEAALRAGFFRPVILSAVGNDGWAQNVLSFVRAKGLPTASIQEVATATDLVCIISIEGRHRVMIMPKERANDRLDRQFTLSVLDSMDARDVSWAFISGYALAGRGSGRLLSAKVLTDWCRHNEIPIVLDLVPHKFRASVGSLSEVTRHLGVPDILIGSLSTIEELGYAHAPDRDASDDSAANGSTAERMTEVAIRASRDWGVVVVQAFTRPGVFGQAVAKRGAALFQDELVLSASGARGAGDSLAIAALQKLG